MTVYTGNASPHTNRIQKIRTSPKLLQIRKGDGGKTLLFSQIRTGEHDSSLSAEEVVSGINWRLTEYGKENNSKVTAVDDYSLADVIRRAQNICFCCHEPISGNEPRYVRITVRIPSVGAEAEECIIGSTCIRCFDSGATVEGPLEPTLDAVDAGAADWKKSLRPRQLEAWNRCMEKGEKQTTVARSMGVSQGQVSKLVAAAAKVRDTCRANIPFRNKIVTTLVSVN
jgi:hypothetical protein